MRYLSTISYDGTNFKGYQVQPNERTVEGEFEKVITKINGGVPVHIVGSGRTDAGVHALAQKVHYDLDSNIDTDKLTRALNSLLPDDIYVKSTIVVDDNFHARFSATGKEYMYIINMGEYNPLERNYVYQYNKKLDINAIERGLKYLEGEHNFKSFTKADLILDDYTRTITEATLIRDSKDINKIIITFVGNGFMRYMVRNMVGTLIMIGEGKLKSEDIITIFKKEDRRSAGRTARSEGLYLKNVFY